MSRSPSRTLWSAALVSVAAYAVVVTSTSAGCGGSDCSAYTDDGCEGNTARVCPESSYDDSHLSRGDCGSSSTCVGPNAKLLQHAGCQLNTCKAGQTSFCDGKDAVSCRHSPWQPPHRVTCPNLCAEGTGESGELFAICASSTTPDPDCAALKPCGEATCETCASDLQSLVVCARQFPAQRIQCPAGGTCSDRVPYIEGRLKCHVGPGYAKCASATPGSFCDGNNRVVCSFIVPGQDSGGYWLAVTPCEKGCIEDAAAHTATCAM